jgi:hypothetical protein
METAAAISMLLNLLSAAAELSLKLQSIGAIIQKANAEGRTTLTEAEWAEVVATDDQARKALQDAIDAQTLPKQGESL